MEVAKVFKPSRTKYLVFTVDYLIPTFIIFSVLTLAYLAIYSSIFKINELPCRLDYLPCDNEAVLAELNKLKGQNIFTLKTDPISAKLTSGDYTIRSAEFTKQLPNIMNVELLSVYPHVALQVQGDPGWVVLDQKLRVIATRDTDPNVPTLVVLGPLTLSVGVSPSDELITRSLVLTRKLFDELSSIKSITLVDEDTIKLNLSNGKVAILTPKKDVTRQLQTLQAVLSDVTILTGVSTIDVRFGRPVLR